MAVCHFISDNLQFFLGALSCREDDESTLDESQDSTLIVEVQLKQNVSASVQIGNAQKACLGGA